MSMGKYVYGKGSLSKMSSYSISYLTGNNVCYWLFHILFVVPCVGVSKISFR